MTGLILPGDPEFEQTLATPPPGWRETARQDGDSYAFVVEPGSGLMRCVGMRSLTDYLEGGEYDERLEEIGTDEADPDFEEDGLLYLPDVPLVVSPADVL